MYHRALNVECECARTTYYSSSGIVVRGYKVLGPSTVALQVSTYGSFGPNEVAVL